MRAPFSLFLIGGGKPGYCRRAGYGVQSEVGLTFGPLAGINFQGVTILRDKSTKKI